ncbi:MAG: SDR family NAD(P)-dependent oxidoreductase [Candidatus Cohnella colombiensis]|uniref:SDR family NAD(P)-dependent oxidoreductase n=1 Tax=Candidatus Cohnella colombiensis TaxID=3121368 RepID=A0AA95EXF4_9BACL|nr:MAG: SDR family NAD(P)-dependent oxidoreductase [Cohnella sp.]
MKLTGHTVLITGGASGIGFALAKQFASRNNQVIVVGRDASKLDKARSAIPGIVTLCFDISNEESRVELANRIAELYPDLSILINNAGIQNHYSFIDAPPSHEAIVQELETNFVAPARLSALLIPHMIRQSEAAIINLSSGLAIAPKAASPIYCASKAALSSFSRTLRYQMEGSSVSVFDVVTPLVDTGMTKGRGRGKISPEQFALAMLAGVAQDRYHLPIGKSKLLVKLHRLMPNVAYRITKNGL